MKFKIKNMDQFVLDAGFIKNPFVELEFDHANPPIGKVTRFDFDAGDVEIEISPTSVGLIKYLNKELKPSYVICKGVKTIIGLSLTTNRIVETTKIK